MIRIVLIGAGDIAQKLAGHSRNSLVQTEWGDVSFSNTRIGDADIYSAHRHSHKHAVSAHNVNYRALIAAAKELRPECVLGLSVCGSLCDDIRVGDIVFPSQIIDMTAKRQDSFYNADGDVRHIDVFNPICVQKYAGINNALAQEKAAMHFERTIVCVDGPRLSTRAETRFFQMIGAECINMSIAPEAFLARELGLCYVAISLVSDIANSDQSPANVADMFSDIATFEHRMQECVVKLLSSDCLRSWLRRSCHCDEAPRRGRVLLTA